MTPPEPYDHPLVAVVHDQMMTGQLADQLERCRRFYRDRLDGVEGPVLEACCGTGLVLLPLLATGTDIRGFDAAAAMIDRLRRNAETAGLDVSDRVWVDRVDRFQSTVGTYDAVVMAGNSFVLLTTAASQRAALTTIAGLLRPGGRLLFDLRLEGTGGAVDGNGAGGAGVGRWHRWLHPDTGLAVEQRVVGMVDPDRHLVVDRWQLRYEGHETELTMTARWVFRSEVEALLDEAGFHDVAVVGSPDGEALVVGPTATESYWSAVLRRP